MEGMQRKNNKDVDKNKGRLFTDFGCDRHRESNPDHIGHFSYAKEESGIEQDGNGEQEHVLFASDNVCKEKGHCSTPYCIEKVETKRGSVEKPPRFVRDKGLEIFAESGIAHSVQFLTCEFETKYEEQEAA